MTYLNDTGFVVRRINLGEADRFVTIFTKNNGKVEVLAKGVRKITSKRSSHIELLNLVKFNSIRTSKNFILTEVALVDSCNESRETLSQCQIVFLVCELIDNLCPFGLVNKELFVLVGNFLKENDFSNSTLLKFETELLMALGYWNMERRFKDEREAETFIESIIERKIKSRVIGNFEVLLETI